MSDSHDVEVLCPSCKKSQTVTTWRSINVTVDPSLRTRLFNGEINVFKCPNCQFEALIPVPLLYHDMRRRFCVQYYPYEIVQDKTFLNQFSEDGHGKKTDFPFPISETFKILTSYLSKPHIVSDLNKLFRYIYFGEKLDERLKEAERGEVMEMTKEGDQ